MPNSRDLRATVRLQNQTIRNKNREIQRLTDALRAFLAQTESDHSDVELNGDLDEDDEDGDSDQEEERREDVDQLPEPIYDDDTYYCTDCAAEVVDGECFACGLMHRWLVDEISRDNVTTDTQAIHSDRSLVPRANTPLLDDIDESNPPTEYCPSHHPVRRDSRLQEYRELLERGATRLMCDTFHLEYTYEGGIYAWADSDLYEQFAGNAMQVGDFWKIHLGRRIALDRDDLDGSAFTEGLLEDGLLFPYRAAQSGRTFEQWETVEETPRIWVTRIKERQGDDDSDEDDENGSQDSDEDDNDLAGYEIDQAIDEALVNPPDGNPAVVDDFSFSDDPSEDDDFDMEDPGNAWHAAYADGVWHNGREEDELDEDEEEETLDDDSGREIRKEPEDADMLLNSDDCDSDFEDDEVLSGDEGVIAAGVRLLPRA